MQFAEQTLTRRDGQPVVYRFNVGPNRAERRDAKFRPRAVAVAAVKTGQAMQTRLARIEAGHGHAWVQALRMLGKYAS